MATKKEALEMIDEIDKSEKAERATEKTEIKKRGRKAGTTLKATLNADECTDKIYQLFCLPFKILNKNIYYTKSDFKAEGETLVRISKKYPLVNTVLLALDPIYLIGSLLEKVNNTLKANKKTKAQG